MRNFTKVLNTCGLPPDLATGPAIDIENTMPLPRIPDITTVDLNGALELPMLNNRGRKEGPPIRAMWTRHASGGCIPLCAAEVTDGSPRTVRWVYLIHCQSANRPINVIDSGVDPKRVFVCASLYSGVFGSLSSVLSRKSIRKPS